MAASDTNDALGRLDDPTTQTRLLHFCADATEINIAVTSETWHRKTATAYNAIPYVWGSAELVCTTQVNGKPRTVGHNYFEALRQAYFYNPQSWIWIDAICIDQQNLDEKAAQVAMMGDVYATAHLVLACIGPADEDIEIVFQATLNLDAVVQEMPLSWYGEPDMRCWNPPQDRASTLQFLDACNKFCERPYFSRVWIVQELFGGGDRTVILCGQQ